MTTTRITIFYSYADKDKRWQEELEKRLSRPRANITIESQHRDQITGGAMLTDVEKCIEQADIILLLLSPDFLAPGPLGHYDSIEIKHIIKLYFDETVTSPSNANKIPHVIPILVRPTNWDGTPFSNLKIVPRSKKALTLWDNPDRAWQQVMYEIDTVIKNFTPSHSDTHTLLIGAPQPIESKMPPQNPFFTGRKDLLLKLHEKFMRPKTTAITHKQIICGLGGIGKTQLAVKYVDRYGTDYKHVFWVNAGTRDMLTQEYVVIAHNLALPERSEKNQRGVVEAVMRWLEMNTDWLLVLDNADNLKIVQEFIPAQINGHLLLTTRAQAVGEIAEPLEIGSMTIEEGTLFLLLRAKKIEPGESIADAHEEDRENAKKIVQELGSLPLALDQAGAYIEEQQEGLGKYLELYQHQGVSILQERGDLPRSHPVSVTKTFLLTFTEVKRSKSNAADVLRLCAFLAPDAIPEKLVTQYLSTLIVGTDSSSQNPKASMNPRFPQNRQTPQPPTPAEIRIMLGEASKALLRYTLVHRDDRTEMLAVHRLVQAVLRENMDENAQRQWAECAVRIVGAAFPRVEIRKMDVTLWPLCQELLPHVSMCDRHIKKWQFAFPDASRLLNDAAIYLTERGQYREAASLYLQALSIRKEKGGLLYAQSLYNLAIVYLSLSNYEEAKQNLVAALDILKQKPDENHLAIALTLSSLGDLYKTLGKFEKAGQFYEDALKISQLSPDPEQFYLSQDFSKQIAFYRGQKNYTKTEELYKEALKKIKQKWGEEHPYTAKTLHDLGEFYKERRKFSEAAPLLQRAWEIREKMLTVKNSDTASSIHSIAELYERQGKAEEAEKLYKQALSIREEVLGADNPETAATLYSLAKLYRAQDKIKEAEQLYGQALAIREKKFGLNHPATLQSQRELADFYKSQGRLLEAEPLYIRGLASGYLNLRHNDPAVIQNLRELVELYTILDKHEEIERLYDEALTQRSSRLGINHPSTEECVQDLLKLHQEHGESEKIVLLYQRTFELRARKLRGDNQDSLQKFEQNLKDLANLYDKLKRPKGKMYLYMKAQGICGRVLGVGDPLERYCYNEWIKMSEDRDLSEEVEKHAKERLVEKTLYVTANLPDTIFDYQQTQRGLVGLLKLQRRFEEAEKIQMQGLIDSYQKLGFDHPASVESRKELVQFYEDHSKFKEAEGVYLVAIQNCKKKLEPQSPHLIECRNDLVSFYLRHKKYEPAKSHIEEMRRFIEPMLEEQPVPEHYTLAIVGTLANAASLYQRIYKRKSKTAESWFEQALQLSEEGLGKDHQETVDIRQRYVSFLREMGRYAEATAIEIDAITMEEAEKNRKDDEKSEDEEPFIVDDDIEPDEEDI